MNKVCIDEIPLQGKRVLIRVDFNVPLKDGQVTDDTRIRESIPTIRYAREQRARVILCSHLGRPKGKPSPAYSLGPVAKHLSQLLAAPVRMAEDCIGAEVQAAVKALQPGEVLLLENLRFHPGEEKNAEEFARALAGLCDVYVNDAFGAAHRAHASTAGITRFVPVAACGFLLRKEIENLGKLLTAPEHPFVAIMGGAKVSDKIGVLKNLIGKVDTFLLGGGMAYTFLKAEGRSVGRSLVEENKVALARETMRAARAVKVDLLPACDHVVAERVAPDVPHLGPAGLAHHDQGVPVGEEPHRRQQRAAVAAQRGEDDDLPGRQEAGDVGIGEPLDHRREASYRGRAVCQRTRIPDCGAGRRPGQADDPRRDALAVSDVLDGEGRQRFEIKPGSIYSPGDLMYHGHFNTGHATMRHFAMRGRVVVTPREEFDTWLAAQPTFQSMQALAKADPTAGAAQYAVCMACHGDYLDGLAQHLRVGRPLRDPGAVLPRSHRCTNAAARPDEPTRPLGLTRGLTRQLRTRFAPPTSSDCAASTAAKTSPSRWRCAASSAPWRRPDFLPSCAPASTTKSRPPSANASSPQPSSAITSVCARSCCLRSFTDTQTLLRKA